MLAPVSLNLSSGEQIIYQGHPSWRAILAFYLKWLLAGVILAVLGAILGWSGITSGNQPRAGDVTGNTSTAWALDDSGTAGIWACGGWDRSR